MLDLLSYIRFRAVVERRFRLIILFHRSGLFFRFFRLLRSVLPILRFLSVFILLFAIIVLIVLFVVLFLLIVLPIVPGGLVLIADFVFSAAVSVFLHFLYVGYDRAELRGRRRRYRHFDLRVL